LARRLKQAFNPPAWRDTQSWLSTIGFLTKGPHEWRVHDQLRQFEIIGRIGEIDARPKVTLLSVCANYRRKGDDDEWQEDSHWNRVSVFSEGQRKHIADRAQVGDLVRIAGRLKDSSYERDGVTHYTTDRIVEEFGILAAKGMPG